MFDKESASTTSGQSPRPLCSIAPAGKLAFVERVPRHLGVFDRGTGLETSQPQSGISDEELASGSAIFLDRFLRYPDGSMRDPKLAAKFGGWRAVWLAQLNEAIRERLAGPPPLTFPPAIFISYRWASAEENQWVADLAAQLRTRGYPIFFDRDIPSEPDVPRLVSRIADARVFIAVLDPGYGERIGNDGGKIYDGWVFDEHQTALRFANAGDLEIVGLWRKGDSLPDSFHQPVRGRLGNTCDVRQPGQLLVVLDRFFPPLEKWTQ